MERLARLDALTGIPNRRLFEEELEKEWARAEREKSSLSIITADIDHFKEYNDRYGHPAGDRCLKQVAQAMESALLRPADTIARIGGEEFAFLLPQTTVSGAKSVARTTRIGGPDVLPEAQHHAHFLGIDRVDRALQGDQQNEHQEDGRGHP